LDEWLTRRKDLYLTTHNTHKRETSMSSAGFEAEIPASSLDSLLDGAGTGIGIHYNICTKITAERTSIMSLKDLNGQKKYKNGIKR